MSLEGAAKRSFDGVPVGLYREGDDLIPIVFRDTEQERRAAASDMDKVQILPTLSSDSVPLSQVTDGIAGLLVMGSPFGFMALLGAMSLSGMIIQNLVVLLDQVNINLAEGMSPYDAVVESAVSRLKPVLNAAATTVFALVPLYFDVFWEAMAVTTMFGLAFATVLTMVPVPVFYPVLYRIPSPKSD